MISGYTGNVRKLMLGMMRGWVLYGFCGMLHQIMGDISIMERSVGHFSPNIDQKVGIVRDIDQEWDEITNRKCELKPKTNGR